MSDLSLQIETTPEGFRLLGALTVDTAAIAYHTLCGERGSIDLSGLTQVDTAGAACLHALLEPGDGQPLSLTNLPSHVEALLSALPSPAITAPPPPPSLERFGDAIYSVAERVQEAYGFAWRTLDAASLLPLRGHRISLGTLARQCVRIGVDALPIVALISFLVGFIIAFQAAYQLERFGATSLVANMVGISMVRELGPLMTAILLAGRSGSSVSAELGTMKVREEVLATETMGLDVYRRLVLPRVLAFTLMGPLLSVMSMAAGIGGGLVIGVTRLQISVGTYIQQTLRFMRLNAFTSGMFKAVIFSMIVGSIATYMGIKLKGGASAVGSAATKTVVWSIFVVIVTDAIITVWTMR